MSSWVWGFMAGCSFTMFVYLFVKPQEADAGDKQGNEVDISR